MRRQKRPKVKQTRRDIDSRVDLAITYLRSGDPTHAETLCRQALAQNPLDADATDLLGVVAHQQGDFRKALKLITTAIAINGRIADFHNHQAISLKLLGRRKEARAAYERAIQLDSRSLGAIFNLAILLREQGEYHSALQLNRKAVKIDPSRPQTHNNLGVTLQEMGPFEEAAKSYKTAIKLNPDHSDAYSNLAVTLAESDRIDQSLKVCDDAQRKWPNDADIINARTNTYIRMNKIEKALDSIEKTFEVDPDHVQAHYVKGMALLLIGEYEAGWREYEWRTKRRNFWPQRNYDAPIWDGGPLKGKVVLVHWEQGFGDIIQFSRFLTVLADHIAHNAGHSGARILFDCPDKLSGLFKGDIPAEVIGDFGDDPPPFDVYIPLMSLPGRLGITNEKIPNDVPYLRNKLESFLKVPDPQPGTMKVGLVWVSDHSASYRRKVFDIKMLARLFKNKSCTFYGIQFGSKGNEIKRYEKADNVVNLCRYLGDFAHTAAIVEQMDLVISIDTYVVHLAGAMNIPAWVLLPFSPDWRWQLCRSDSRWYPSLRLFRQPEPGDWHGVINSVSAALVELVQQRNDTIEQSRRKLNAIRLS